MDRVQAEFEREWELLTYYGMKESWVREEYEDQVRKLTGLGETLRQQGYPVEEIARRMHQERRKLGVIYKKAALPYLREYIYDATEKKYGDPLGPSFAQLRQKKTCEEIIESATRPIDNLDHRITMDGFRAWVEENRQRLMNVEID